MVVFFTTPEGTAYAVESTRTFTADELERLRWLFGNAEPQAAGSSLSGRFIGPRKEMITPWSTNAVEITQNMGIDGISRIEMFVPSADGESFDPMLQKAYSNPGPDVFEITATPEPHVLIENIHEYNQSEGLALSPSEEEYLDGLSKRLGRPLTDSEVFGFSQVNSR